MRLVLASTSPYRRALLERLHLPFDVHKPEFAEHTAHSVPDPGTMVVANALGKARSLVDLYPDALVIGSDQAAVCHGHVLGKPGTEERAVAQLLELAGREHELLTAVALVGTGVHAAREETALVVNTLRIRPLTPEQARTYVRREQPLHCAGAYMSEGLGIALFEYLRGDDPTAIIGLPLVALCALLRRFDVDPLAQRSARGGSPAGESAGGSAAGSAAGSGDGSGDGSAAQTGR